jgi:hypothetical protein
MTPDYPLYIVSKGRPDSRMTVHTLERMRLDYRIVIEEQEYDAYAAVIRPDRLLILDRAYQREYQTLDDAGDTKSTGPGPARNFAWQHSIAAGHRRHWVLDDNILCFYRMAHNLRHKVLDGSGFAVMEQFVERYDNLAIAGPNYHFFAKRKQVIPPVVFNTRIYSCLLIDNQLPFRWRGRYNEDTILALDVLTAGYCTAQFNAFLQHKVGNQTLRGGNTDEFYLHEGTKPKSQLLVDVYPQYATLTWKFNRWHHQVDYRPFRVNQLRRRADVVVEPGVNDFGMRLVSVAQH